MSPKEVVIFSDVKPFDCISQGEGRNPHAVVSEFLRGRIITFDIIVVRGDGRFARASDLVKCVLAATGDARCEPLGLKQRHDGLGQA